RVRTKSMHKTMATRANSAVIITCLPYAVVHYPGRRPGEGLRQHLQHEGKGDRAWLSGQLQQQAVNGERIEPVANFTDNLRGPEAAEIAVVTQQPSVGRYRHRPALLLGTGVHKEQQIPDRTLCESTFMLP